MSGPITVTDQPFPPDVVGVFVGGGTASVIVVIGDRQHVWPWREAMTFAIELARMAGMASVRDPEPLDGRDD